MNQRSINTFAIVKRIYEISIPHFTPEGTFDAAIGQLNGLSDFGIDALYILPINPTDIKSSKSPYCIIDHFDVREELGGFQGLKLFTQAAHELNLKVILDVVLNHASKNHLSAGDLDFLDRDQNKRIYNPIGTDWNDVYQINHHDIWYSYRSLNALLHFMELGIDGFRFDATSFISDRNFGMWLNGLIEKNSDVILWSDTLQIDRSSLPFTHTSIPLGIPKIEFSSEIIKIASLGSHDLLRNKGSLLEVYGEEVGSIQQELIQKADAFLFPMGSEKGFDFKYDFFL